MGLLEALARVLGRPDGGALDGVIWIGAVAAVVGESGSWAVAVMLGGAGLVGLAVLVARIRPALEGTAARL